MQWHNSISNERNQTSNKSPINIDDLVNELGEYMQSSNKLNAQNTNIYMHNNNFNFSSNQNNSNYQNTIHSPNTHNFNFTNQNTNSNFYNIDGGYDFNKTYPYIDNNITTNNNNNYDNIKVNNNANYYHYNLNAPFNNDINQKTNYDSANRNIERLNDIFYNMGGGGDITNLTYKSGNNENHCQINNKLIDNGNFYERKMTSPLQDDEFEEVLEDCNNNIINENSNFDNHKSDLYNQLNNKNNKTNQEYAQKNQQVHNDKIIYLISNNKYNSSNLNSIQAPENKKTLLNDFNVDLIFDNFHTKDSHDKDDEFQEVEEQESPVRNNNDDSNITTKKIYQHKNTNTDIYNINLRKKSVSLILIEIFLIIYFIIKKQQ